MISDILKELFYPIISIIENDPCKHCRLYKEKGCAFVDGLLCDFPNCRMNKEYCKNNKL